MGVATRYQMSRFTKLYMSMCCFDFYLLKLYIGNESLKYLVTNVDFSKKSQVNLMNFPQNLASKSAFFFLEGKVVRSLSLAWLGKNFPLLSACHLPFAGLTRFWVCKVDALFYHA